MTSRKTTGTAGVGAAEMSPAGTDEIRADIDRTREELGDSVSALATRADLKARARDGVATVKTRAGEAARQVGGAARRKPVPMVAALAGLVAIAGAVVMMKRSRAAKARATNRFRWPR